MGETSMAQNTSRRMTLLLSVVSLSLAATGTGWSETQAPELETPKAKQIQALVDKAAQLIASKGQAAFPEFHQKGSEWFNGDTYVFVFDMKGKELVNPAFPNLENTDVLELKDKNGKFLNKEFIALLGKQDAGWVDYYFPKPGTDRIAKKWAYIKRADLRGTPVGVGIGLYLE
jgi:cytochrome c